MVAHSPRRAMIVSALLAVTLLLSAGGAYWLGARQSFAETGSSGTDLALAREQLAQSASEIGELKQRLLQMEQAAVVDREALESVRQTILALREQNSRLEEEVLFYQQIMSPDDADAGLVIGNISLVATTDPSRVSYKLELKQLGNNENLISGQASIEVIGVRQGEELRLPLSQLSPGAEQYRALEFRYFQNLEGELQLPTDFAPASLQVLVAEDGPGGKLVQKSFDWLVENPD